MIKAYAEGVQPELRNVDAHVLAMLNLPRDVCVVIISSLLSPSLLLPRFGRSTGSSHKIAARECLLRRADCQSPLGPHDCDARPLVRTYSSL